MWRLIGPAWFIGNITKYAERCYDKGGLDDVDKVIHYAQKLRELTAAWLDGSGPPPGVVNLTKLNGVRGANLITRRKAEDAARTQDPAPPPCARRDETEGPARRDEEANDARLGVGMRVQDCSHCDRELVQTAVGSGTRCRACGHTEAH